MVRETDGAAKVTRPCDAAEEKNKPLDFADGMEAKFEAVVVAKRIAAVVAVNSSLATVVEK